MSPSAPPHLHVDTPFLYSSPLSAASGTRVYVKMDSLQPSGSFKIRGIGHMCQRAYADGAREFVCASGGNAGLAVAYAARCLCARAVIYVPSTTPEFLRDRLTADGAEVRVHGSVWNEADLAAREYVSSSSSSPASQRVYIPAFDHPDLWEGHASIVREMLTLGIRPAAIVCAVGGGGLLNGIVRGLSSCGLSDVPVLAVETHGANCFAEAVRNGSPVRLPAITSIAKSLGALQVSDESLRLSKVHRIVPFEVSDRQAAEACARFLDDHRVLVEPACGAALAAAYIKGGIQKALGVEGAVFVVVCGGQAVTMKHLEEWLQTLPAD